MKRLSTDEDPALQIESFAVINLHGVSTNKTIILSDLLQGYSNKSDTCSHDITILLEPCVVKLVTFLFHHECIRFVRKTL
jgi:hypothetical protein